MSEPDCLRFRADYLHFRPAHSDFLIYWTGRDIDDKGDKGERRKNGARAHSSTTTPDEQGDTIKEYLDRLESVLRWGLWMTDPDDEEGFGTARHAGKRQCVARTCFTELKLSEVRSHADRFGRLGIGFKRPFVMARGGMPVWYYPRGEAPGIWDRWVESLGRTDLKFKEEDLYACFMKPIGHKDADRRYEFLNESEWRIIHSNWLSDKGYAIDPANPPAGFEPGFDKYLQETQETGCSKPPRYLLNAQSEWLALIIYPSIQVRYAAQEDEKLRKLLRKIKPRNYELLGEPKTDTEVYEPHVLPTELDLDSCRNF